MHSNLASCKFTLVCESIVMEALLLNLALRSLQSPVVLLAGDVRRDSVGNDTRAVNEDDSKRQS